MISTFSTRLFALRTIIRPIILVPFRKWTVSTIAGFPSFQKEREDIV
jgi:hypothetical protein